MSNDATNNGDYFRRMLTALFEFMRRSGFSKHEILSISKTAIEAADSSDATSFASPTDLVAASNVLDRWWNNRRYIDEAAQPRALPLLGRAPSVEALVKLECRSHRGTLQPHQMKTFGLISHAGGGKYKPSVPSGIVRDLNQATQHQVAHALYMLLRTITGNVSTSDKSNRLIERFAEIPDLPAAHRAEFREFAKQQGHVFIQTVNRWLDARRAARRTPKHRASVAGIHVYAYLGEPSVAKRRRRKDLVTR